MDQRQDGDRLNELQGEISDIKELLKTIRKLLRKKMWSQDEIEEYGNKEQLRAKEINLMQEQNNLKQEQNNLKQEQNNLKEEQSHLRKLRSDSAYRLKHILASVESAIHMNKSILPERKSELWTIARDQFENNRNDLLALEYELLEPCIHGDDSKIIDIILRLANKIQNPDDLDTPSLLPNHTLKCTILSCRSLLEEMAANNETQSDLVRRSISMCRWFIINSRLFVDEVFNSGNFDFHLQLNLTWAKPWLKSSSFKAPSNNPFRKSSIDNSGYPVTINNAEEYEWFMAENHVLSFFCSDHTLPKQKFNILWNNIFSCFLLSGNVNYMKLLPEFRMKTIHNYSDQRVDLAAGILFKDICFPVLLVEASGFQLPNDSVDPKDYQKLAVEMQACLLHDIGLFRNDLEMIRSLKVFGAFTCAFQTLPHWRYSLIDANSKCVDDNCKYCLDTASSSSHSISEATILSINFNQDKVDFTEADFVNAQNEMNCTRFDISVDDLNSDEVADVVSMHQEIMFPALLSMKCFTSQVKDYSKRIYEWLGRNAENMQHQQFNFPKSLPPGPSSRSSHESATPKRQQTSLQTPTKKNGLRSKLFGNFSISRRGNRQVAGITKEGSSREIELLSKVQGMPGIVELLMSEIFPNQCFYKMVEDLLIDIVAPEPHDPNFLTFVMKFMFDGVSALHSLKSKRIIHRNICLKNFKFSPFYNGFRLFDFDLAVELPLESYKYENYGIVGTEGFIAPEVLKGEAYDFAIDVFSFSVCMDRSIFLPLGFYEDGNRIEAVLLNQLYHIYVRCSNEIPTRRPDSEWLCQTFLPSVMETWSKVLKLGKCVPLDEFNHSTVPHSYVDF